MKRLQTVFGSVILLEPEVHVDHRGFFFEAYNRRTCTDLGITPVFVQDNHSGSVRDTLRGMHYQAPPHAQDKLIRVLKGVVFDVVVDVRHGSPTFGRWAGFELSEENRRLLFVPKGFAHGFCVVSEYAEVLYKCSDYYAPECERGFRWDDPAVGIRWPVERPILSARDAAHPFLQALPRDFLFEPTSDESAGVGMRRGIDSDQDEAK